MQRVHARLGSIAFAALLAYAAAVLVPSLSACCMALRAQSTIEVRCPHHPEMGDTCPMHRTSASVPQSDGLCRIGCAQDSPSIAGLADVIGLISPAFTHHPFPLGVWIVSSVSLLPHQVVYVPLSPPPRA
jgi:hypothetical protein